MSKCNSALVASVVCMAVSMAAVAQQTGLLAGNAAIEPEGGDLVTLDSIRVTDVRVEGSTIFSEAEFAEFTAPYRNRALTFDQLQELRHALSAAYLERGYVNSGVVIPDQQIQDGVIVLRAIEGELTEIDVAGNRRLNDRAVMKRVERQLGQPLDINELQANLMALQEDPIVVRVNAQLLPGAAPGESYLQLSVTEQPPLELTFGANNHRPPSVGENHGTVGLTYRGLAGNGDVVQAAFGVTHGANDYVVSYAAPVNAKGTQLEFFATDQESDIVEAPFDAIDIASHLESWGIRGLLPFVRSGAGSVTGIVGFEHRKSESTLLGVPFSFSPGDVDGKARGSAVSLGLEWTRRHTAQAFSVRGQFEYGVDVLDATIDPAGTDSRFSLFRGQFQYLLNIGWRDSHLLARTIAQVSAQSLLAMYKLPVGGRYTVRGYRENQLVRDNAVTASIEYQFPLLVDELGQSRNSLRLAVFADYGVSWDVDDALATSAKRKIYSAGLGLLWEPIPGFSTELYWGGDLADVKNRGSVLQDDGIHYQLSFSRAF